MPIFTYPWREPSDEAKRPSDPKAPTDACLQILETWLGQDVMAVAVVEAKIGMRIVRCNSAFSDKTGIEAGGLLRDHLDGETLDHLKKFPATSKCKPGQCPGSFIILELSTTEGKPLRMELLHYGALTDNNFLLIDIQAELPSEPTSPQDPYRLIQELSDLNLLLLRSEHLEDSISDILEWMGTVLGVDRVRIQQFTPSERGLWFQTTQYWASEPGFEIPPGEETGCFQHGYAEYDDRRHESGDVKFVDAANCSGPDRLGMVLVGTFANLSALIMVEGKPWGELSVERTTGVQAFEGWQVQVLRSIAINLGAAIERQTSLTRLQQSRQEVMHLQKLEAMGRLAGGIAHEFNNVLGAMIGHAYLLQEEVDYTGNTKDCIEEIISAGQRATNVVERLLVFSRKPRRRGNATPVNDTATHFYPMLRGTMTPNIDISVLPLDEELYVPISSGQLEQLVLNLCINSRDAMPNGGLLRITIERSKATREQANRHGTNIDQETYAVIRVEDDGEGIDPTTLERIFEPFFTTKPPGSGLGLGMAIVREVVTGFQGFIEVESTPGSGTTVELWLPEVPAPEVAPEKEPEQEEPRGSELILVVDDESALRYLVRHRLETLGYTVIDAPNATIGLEIAESQPIELVLIDIVLPGMSGDEMAEILKQKYPNLPLIFMTGYFQPQSQDIEALPTGNPHMLRKPFRLTELSRKVREVLDRSSTPDPSQPLE